MIKTVQIVRKPSDPLCDTSLFSMDVAGEVNDFHRSFEEYCVTPLVDLKNLAGELGVRSIFLKDESWRFGLNAFKVLGGSYAIGKYIASSFDGDISSFPADRLISDEVKKRVGDITFVTATDGNHGRGVAWTASRLRQKSVVYMPWGTAPERLENIQKLGSEASILDLNYDGCVREAADRAGKEGWVLIQDTSWPGYEEVPLHIMQGYTTMGYEVVSSLGGCKPTHIFLQAGVGAMAGAMTAFFADLYKGSDKPIITVVEPSKADCLFRTAEADDGRLHVVEGPMDSIMAGLCCGEPCSIGWEILRSYADFFISVDDYYAAQGMRVLGNPLPGDTRVISGESGAVTIGLVTELLRCPELRDIRDQLGLDGNSVILCISTEGATDRENYKRIVRDGAFSKNQVQKTII